MSEELEILAAEYALGTLPADERARFDERLARDPAAREAVRRWRENLLPLDEAAIPETPSPTVWRSIEAAAFGRVPVGSAEIIRLRRRVAVWRGSTIAAGALAAGIAALAYLGMIAPPSPQSGRYVAVVDTGGREPALIAELDTGTGLIRVRSLNAETPAGHSLELWHVAEGHEPRSLGVLTAAEQEIPGSPSSGPVDGVIAVTVEPEGGSPSGAPTGPIVYSGRLIPVE